MKIKKIIAALFLGLFLMSCQGNAKELYDSAAFEEQQNNPIHAKELYEEIVKKYPDNEYAAKAKQRLEALKGR